MSGSQNKHVKVCCLLTIQSCHDFNMSKDSTTLNKHLKITPPRAL